MRRRAYIVMTAMPPTRGHAALIHFASWLDVSSVEVILCTQPDEPWAQERYDALSSLKDVGAPIRVHRMHRELPQEPEGGDPAFWSMWAGILSDAGISTNDYIVASEEYGKELARITGTKFMPYDIQRDVVRTKATTVRNSPFLEFDQILPEFQAHLQQVITIFGAESTGKTTLSRDLATSTHGMWIPEWARPYLETVGTEITDESMTAIWRGQAALQAVARDTQPMKPFIIQDTDLYSTVGYWDYMLPSETPQGLIDEAKTWDSDLYLVTQSNIPFEEDPIRYGGDHRETEDHHWTDILDKYNLNYVVLQETDRWKRLREAQNIILDHWHKNANLNYTRRGREYAA